MSNAFEPTNPTDSCAYCGRARANLWHRVTSDPGTHVFVEPAPQPAPSGDEAKVREIARAEAESIATRWVPAHMTARQGMVDDITASLVRYRTLASENGCAKTAAEAWAGLQRGDNVIDLMESRERDAYAAGKADEAKVLDMDDETLVAEIAFEVGQATKQQPEMGGRCRRLHDDAENRRIARAAIRTINRIARRGSEGK